MTSEERFSSAAEIFVKAEIQIRRLKREIPHCTEQYPGDFEVGDFGVARCDQPGECCAACKLRFELRSEIATWKKSRRNAMRRAMRLVDAKNPRVEVVLTEAQK